MRVARYIFIAMMTSRLITTTVASNHTIDSAGRLHTITYRRRPCDKTSLNRLPPQGS